MLPVSQRLIFESLHEKHFSFFKSMDMDPEVMKFIRKATETEEQARASFDRLLSYNKTYPGYGAFIASAGTEYIGMGVLIHIELRPENRNYEVGYRLARSAWGKGYATEIARALIEYGFNHLQLREIFGTTHPDHLVSQKTLMKAGLKDIGTAPYYNGSSFFRIARD